MLMKSFPKHTFSIAAFLLSCAVLTSVTANAQGKSKYACDEAQPDNMCSAANTCGSATSPCTVDITRSLSSSNVRPSIPNARNNQLFCVKAGTTVVWTSSKKNTGFTVAFGADSPFEPDTPIMGGASKKVVTRAATPGCYKYDAGSFTSGTIYGMSSGSKPELIILP
jgi:plastocyanin